MKIAVCQAEGVNGDVAKAIDLVRSQAEVAASRGASLVVFPEMFLTGYNIGETAFKLAEPVDGPLAAAEGPSAGSDSVKPASPML